MDEKWSNRWAFILASIGSAVGLGNAWRFPGLCAQFGGGAFLIAYIICMLFLGIPILMAEIAIGRKVKKSAPHSLKAIHKHGEYVGWTTVANTFFMITYYAVVFAWCILMCIMSYKFATDASTTETASTLWQNTIGTSFTTSLAGDGWHIAPIMIVCFVIAWGLMYWCIKNGTKQLGKVVKYTVLLPIILLFILAIAGFIGNPYLGEALKALFIPQFSSFASTDLWINALGQAFFSLSIVTSIMFTYGSYLKEDSNIAVDAMIIGFSDLAVSVLSGIVLFTTMYSTGLTVNDMSASGIATAFVIYPTAIVNLTSSGLVNAIFGFVFYFMLCTLAIDSAFSLLEAVASAVKEKFNIKKKKAIKIVATLAIIIGITYLTKAGVGFLDITDNWICNYGLIFCGIFEAIFIGWLFKPRSILAEINRNTKKFKAPKWWFYSSMKFFVPISLTILFVWQLVDFAKKGFRYDINYSLSSELVFGWSFFFVSIFSGLILNYVLKKSKKGRSILEINGKEPSWNEIENRETA